MNIETKITPNPETLKFMFDKDLLNTNGLEFKNKNEASNHKFPSELFKINGVKNIFLGPNFASITKDSNINWAQLKPKVLTFMIDFLNSNEVLIDENKINLKKEKTNLPLDKMSKEIKKIIDSKVRPAVARDGGDIIFENYKNGIVYLTLKGACSGCPSSTATLKQGIENLLKHYFPEVKAVEAIN